MRSWFVHQYFSELDFRGGNTVLSKYKLSIWTHERRGVFLSILIFLVDVVGVDEMPE